jgi:hypothetical protein
VLTNAGTFVVAGNVVHQRRWYNFKHEYGNNYGIRWLDKQWNITAVPVLYNLQEVRVQYLTAHQLTVISNFTLNKGSSTASVLDLNGTGAVTCSNGYFTSGLLRINAGASYSKVNGNIGAIAAASGIHV